MMNRHVALLLFPFLLRMFLPLSQWQAVEAGPLSGSSAALLLVALGTWRQIAPLAYFLFSCGIVYGWKALSHRDTLDYLDRIFFLSPRMLFPVPILLSFERHVTLPHPSHGCVTTFILLRFRISCRYVPMSAFFLSPF